MRNLLETLQKIAEAPVRSGDGSIVRTSSGSPVTSGPKVAKPKAPAPNTTTPPPSLSGAGSPKTPNATPPKSLSGAGAPPKTPAAKPAFTGRPDDAQKPANVNTPGGFGAGQPAPKVGTPQQGIFGKIAPKPATPASQVTPTAGDPGMQQAAAPKPQAKPISSPARAAQASKTTNQNVTYQDLAKRSGIADPNKIRPGQEIKLPSGGTYKVQKGDTLSQIAQNVRRGNIGGATAASPAASPAAKPSAKPTAQKDMRPVAGIDGLDTVGAPKGRNKARGQMGRTQTPVQSKDEPTAVAGNTRGTRRDRRAAASGKDAPSLAQKFKDFIGLGGPQTAQASEPATSAPAADKPAPQRSSAGPQKRRGNVRPPADDARAQRIARTGGPATTATPAAPTRATASLPSGDVDTGDNASANTGNWTPPGGKNSAVAKATAAPTGTARKVSTVAPDTAPAAATKATAEPDAYDAALSSLLGDPKAQTSTTKGDDGSSTTTSRFKGKASADQVKAIQAAFDKIEQDEREAQGLGGDGGTTYMNRGDIDPDLLGDIGGNTEPTRAAPTRSGFKRAEPKPNPNGKTFKNRSPIERDF